MRHFLLVASLLVGATASAQTPSHHTDKPRLVVMALIGAGGVEATLSSALTDTVTAEVSARGFFDVVSANDIQTLLGLERQRQMVGCSDTASSCLSELAGALGARFVMSGSVAKLGDAYQLNLQTLDSSRAQPLGRATRIARDLPSLRMQMPFAVAEATATPLPPPPSKILPISFLSLGGLALIGGGVVGLQALTQEGAITRELNNGSTNSAALKSLPSYRDESAVIASQKTLALVGACAGAALLTAGILFWPADTGGRGLSASLTVAPNGAALVGIWP